MKTAVLVVCLFGLAYAYPSRSDSSSSPQDSSETRSISDSSPSSSEEGSLPPPGNDTTQIMFTDEQVARGDSLRRKRQVRQRVSSSESHSKSVSDSYPDTSSSEEFSVAPPVDGTTAAQPRGDTLRRRRAAGQDPNTSSIESSESVTTESTSKQSHPSDSSEESHERSTKQNLLQGIRETSTVPDTSEESSEERTTPAFQP